ncbi:hypothetical protein D3C84_806390 [compost metagenome]
MKRDRHFQSFERLVFLELLANPVQHRHMRANPIDFQMSFRRQRHVRYNTSLFCIRTHHSPLPLSFYFIYNSLQIYDLMLSAWNVRKREQLREPIRPVPVVISRHVQYALLRFAARPYRNADPVPMAQRSVMAFAKRVLGAILQKINLLQNFVHVRRPKRG